MQVSTAHFENARFYVSKKKKLDTSCLRHNLRSKTCVFLEATVLVRILIKLDGQIFKRIFQHLSISLLNFKPFLMSLLL
jgi:hypothetical protein